MMNSKERLKKALAGQPTDVPAVAPCYLELYLENLINVYYLAAYERKLAGRHSCKIDPAEDITFRVEAIHQAYRVLKEQPDWLHVPYAPLRSWAENGRIERQGERMYYTHQKTGKMIDLQEAGEVAFPSSVRFLEPSSTRSDHWQAELSLRSRADVDKQVPVRPVDDLMRAGMFDVASLMAKRYGSELYLRCETGTPYWNTYTVLGFEQMMTGMHTQPELFQYIMQRKHAQRMELLKGFAAVGIQGVWVEECLASADLISKSDYERFVFSTALAYLEEIKSLGLDRVLYFCGDVVPRLAWLRQLPLNAIAVEESKKSFSVSIADVIHAVGDIFCVFGNVDSVNIVQCGALWDIRQEVHQQIVHGRKARGFVLCQGSPFPLDTDPAKVDAFIRAGRENW